MSYLYQKLKQYIYSLTKKAVLNRPKVKTILFKLDQKPVLIRHENNFSLIFNQLITESLPINSIFQNINSFIKAEKFFLLIS